jgi:hypothetical protein
MRNAFRFIGLIMASTLASAQALAQAPGPWDQPAAALADQIAAILGPGQVRLAIRNLSSISVGEVPLIQKLIEQDLRAHGVQASGAESASTIRVTLSENVRERLWVAEIVEGSETHVTMVHVDAAAPQPPTPAGGITLRKQALIETSQPVLSMIETANGIVDVEPEEIVLFHAAPGGWQELKRFAIGQKRALMRDPRGAIASSGPGDGFDAYVAGTECSGEWPAGGQSGTATISCRESDDPWPILELPLSTGAVEPSGVLHAFYNAGRNYFTGVITPNPGIELPPFYSAALVPRSGGEALLIIGIDGKVQSSENGTLKAVSGTRDWGSDMATLHSGCDAGNEVIASGSGEAATDSLRAYAIPAQEAVPVSAPLALEGAVTAMWTARDGRSVYAVARKPTGSYEVDRVTAICD